MGWLNASKGYILKREYEVALKRLLECTCIFSEGLHPQSRTEKEAPKENNGILGSLNSPVGLLIINLTR
jgi:hypothetical protein